MNVPTTETTQTIHEFYLQLTGLPIPYSMQRHYNWEQWLCRGHTREDLKLVISYLSGRIKDGKRQRECLLFRNLISNVEYFEEDLAMARATGRERQFRHCPGKESVLRTTGRADTLTNEPKQAGQVMAEHALMAKLIGDWKNGFFNPSHTEAT